MKNLGKKIDEMVYKDWKINLESQKKLLLKDRQNSDIK